MKTLREVIYEAVNNAAAAAASEPWFQAAPAAFDKVFAQQASVVAGDIWDELKLQGHDISRHRSAIGALFMRAEKSGLIQRMEQGYFNSLSGNTPFGHGHIVLWRRAA